MRSRPNSLLSFFSNNQFKIDQAIFSAFLLLMTFFSPLEGVYITRFNTINNGAITFTGNALGLSKLGGQNEPGTDDSIGAYITTDSTSQVGTYPFSTTPPAGTTLTWQNNNLSAVLDLPEGSTVLYAELVWFGSYGFAGEIPYDPSNPSIFIPTITSVTLTTPDAVNHSVAPDPATIQEAVTPGFTNMGNYVRSADVTSLIQAGGAGTYVVGGVPSTVAASDDTHNTAGWTLAVVYANPEMFTSNLTVFVGCEQASYTTNSPAEVTGFCAPPVGSLSGRLFISAAEGDANKAGDHMLFGPTTPLTYPANALAGVNNPIDNFFASQINTLLPLTTDPLTGKLIAVGSS